MSRAPTSTTSASDTGRNPGTEAVSPYQHRPASAAIDMPSRKPVGVVSGVLKSACASSQMTPMPEESLGVAARTPLTVPSELPQFPARTSGNPPPLTAPHTASDSARYAANDVPISVGKGA